MSDEPTKNDDDDLREELVAYLDGELDTARSRAIEQRLTDEPQTRRMLQELDRTWHMLDELDGPTVDPDFTQTTMEMVALAAEGDAAQFRAETPRRVRRQWLAAAAALAAAALGGIAVAIWVIPDPNAQLLRELPLLENLDSYRQVGDVEVLRALDREKVFDATSTPRHGDEQADETTSQRRQRVVEMGDSQREDLSRHREQFHAMDPAQQQRIRLLDEQIQDDPQREQLRRTMNQYCQWLAGLPPYRRAELAEMPLPQRIKQIKSAVQEQTRSSGKELEAADVEAGIHWIEQYATEHEAKILDMLQDNRRRQAAKLKPAMRHRIVMGMLCQRWLSSNPAVAPPTTDREMADLRAALSAETRSRLDAKPPAEQAHMLAAGLRQAARQEMASRRAEGATLLGFDEQLADFFEFQLDDEQRDHLLSLPGEEMQQKLREMFLLQTRPGEPGGHHGDHFGRGRRNFFVEPRPKKDGKEPPDDGPGYRPPEHREPGPEAGPDPGHGPGPDGPPGPNPGGRPHP